VKFRDELAHAGQNKFLLAVHSRKRAIPLDTMWAKARVFDTTPKCFAAGPISGNLLKRMVSAEGIESTGSRDLNNT
jgi:hypothetical protein